MNIGIVRHPWLALMMVMKTLIHRPCRPLLPPPSVAVTALHIGIRRVRTDHREVVAVRSVAAEALLALAVTVGVAVETGVVEIEVEALTGCLVGTVVGGRCHDVVVVMTAEH